MKGIGLQAEMVAKDYLDPKGRFATRPGTYADERGARNHRNGHGECSEAEWKGLVPQQERLTVARFGEGEFLRMGEQERELGNSPLLSRNLVGIVVCAASSAIR